MTKSDHTLQEIKLEPATEKQNKPNWANDKTINAFDTETSAGTVFLLSYNLDGFSGYIGNKDGSELATEQIINKLTHSSCRSAINVWYNLDFDANAILSGLLNQEQQKELTIQNKTTLVVDNVKYEIDYVKSKFMILTDSHGNVYRHFDISQFFYTSLDNAANEWIDKTKKETVDTEQFSNPEYIKENYSKITEYAEKDATITKELATELINQAEKLDIPMGLPFSTGYLSAEYLRNKMDSKPNFGSKRYQSMFWESYYGGRFEVFERGNIGNVVGADINSAYPAVMSELPEPTSLRWERKDEFNNLSIEDLQNADFGVVRCKVATNPEKKIQPFAVKIGGTVKYPILTMDTVTVLKDIFVFAYENNYLRNFELQEAWLGYETENTTYPFQFMKELYGERKLSENRKNMPKKGKLLKIVLNSAYGKTCQTTESVNIETIPENEGLDLSNEPYKKVIPNHFFSLKQREILDENEIAIRDLICGKRFNPFFASYITGLTRLKLHQTVEKYNLVNDTVMFATDCIMIRENAYRKSDFANLIEDIDKSNLTDSEYKDYIISELGGWDFDYIGNAFVVGSGVYQIDKENGIKMKTRGFPESQINGTLKEMAEKHRKGIPIDNERPLTMAEIMRSTDKEQSVSEFVEMRKQLKPDFDSKRKWEKEDITFTDLLNNVETSKPIDLINEQIEQIKQMQEIYEQKQKGNYYDNITNISKPHSV
jgi:hypothetical protein